MPVERSKQETNPPPKFAAYVTNIPNMKSSEDSVGETLPTPEVPDTLTKGEISPEISSKDSIGVNVQCLDSASASNSIKSVGASESVLNMNSVINETNKTLPAKTAAAASASETYGNIDLLPVINNNDKIEKNDQCPDSVKDTNIPINVSGSEKAVNSNIITNTEVGEILKTSDGDDDMAAAAAPKVAVRSKTPVPSDNIEKLVNDTVIIHIKNLQEELQNEITRNKQRDEAIQILFNYLDKKVLNEIKTNQDLESNTVLKQCVAYAEDLRAAQEIHSNQLNRPEEQTTPESEQGQGSAQTYAAATSNIGAAGIQGGDTIQNGGQENSQQENRGHVTIQATSQGEGTRLSGRRRNTHQGNGGHGSFHEHVQDV